ncbi:MAG: hypothetical protein LBH20_01100 [Treponema sp.]|jgi:hypothetical protein|nr:hypothetical protein [Treponema sp.]
MKQLWIFTVTFLFWGICFISAQDLIVLRNGNIIEAKIIEVSSTRVTYQKYDNLEGLHVIANLNTVLSIKYENGVLHIVNPAPVAGQQSNQPNTAAKQQNTQRAKYQTTAIDEDAFIFGINANAGGALGYIWEGAAGAGINIELGKGHFNSEINLMFPTGGFGILATFNGFWPSQIGGFYLGGGIGFSIYQSSSVYRGSSDGQDYYGSGKAFSLPLGLNIGYKFVKESGLYFRTGAYAAFDLSFISNRISPFYFKPDLAIGWTMR